MTVSDNFSFVMGEKRRGMMGSGINRSYSEGIKWRTWQQRLGSLILILGGVNFLFCFNLEVETPVEKNPPLPLLDPKLHMNNPLTIT